VNVRKDRLFLYEGIVLTYHWKHEGKPRQIPVGNKVDKPNDVFQIGRGKIFFSVKKKKKKKNLLSVK
jgi:hypothetical protein